MNHLTALTEDSTVKACDKQKLKGYILKWRDSKMQLGCALFHDLLKPSAILCKILQDEEICVVSAIEAVLKTNKVIDKFNSTAFLQSRRSLLESNTWMAWQVIRVLSWLAMRLVWPTSNLTKTNTQKRLCPV